MNQIYRGITPYDSDTHYQFVGREKETWTLYDRVIRNNETIYYAASGEGKSSLIKAGLVPILQKRNFYPIYIVFTEKELKNEQINIDDIISSRITEELKKHQNITYELSKQSIQFTKDLSHGDISCLSNNVWWRIRNFRFKQGEKELIPVFIFDQFEEVFTKVHPLWTNHFFSWLERMVSNYIPDSLKEHFKDYENASELSAPRTARFLFSMRTEYLGELDYWCLQKHYLPSMQDNRLCLKALTPKGAEEVIRLNKDFSTDDIKQIIQGCTDTKHETEKDWPCVSALILSVVCQTMSLMEVKERNLLLANLKKNKEETIDKILMRFYTDKLKEAGLDYLKDENIITSIEEALIDTNGKRKRRENNEDDIEHLNSWLNKLAQPNNGLLKVIAEREDKGKYIQSIEFPHDRLCKAIDSFRKIRQLKTNEKLFRQMEWIQFGLIMGSLLIVLFLWNNLMPIIKPFMNKFNSAINQIDVSKIIECFTFIPKEIDLFISTQTILLMLSLVLFIPSIVLLIVRKKTRWQKIVAIISTIGCISFSFIIFNLHQIEKVDNYLKTITFIGWFFSLVTSLYSIFQIRKLSKQIRQEKEALNKYSCWPLFGALFILTCYILYETTTRLTFGINEPKDSAWLIAVIPTFSFLWAWGYFKLVPVNYKISKILIIGETLTSFIILCLLAYICYLPYQNAFRLTWGQVIPCCLIFLYGIILFQIFKQLSTSSVYHKITDTKRYSITALNIIILISVYIISLGYNPLLIDSKSIYKVFSWRSVIVGTYLNPISPKTKLGIVSATGDSDSIFQCRLHYSSDIHTGTMIIKEKMNKNPFIIDSITSNVDKTFTWNQEDSIATCQVPFLAVLEKEISTILRSQPKDSTNLEHAIKYYAASLFREWRNANVNYILKGIPYNIEQLPSLNTLEDLQHKRMIHTLNQLVEKANYKRPQKGKGFININILTDIDLIDFQQQLTRRIILSMLKTNIEQNDIPSTFTLLKPYQFIYFPYTQCSQFNINMTIDNTTNISISSNDILENKPYAWYRIFDFLYHLDIYTTSLHCHTALKQNVNIFKKSPPYSNDFIEIKNEVLPPILKILNADLNGIYNNFFENVGLHLVNMASLRGFSVSNDRDLIEKYKIRKNLLNSSIKEFEIKRNELKTISNTIKKIRDENKELYDMLLNMIVR